MRVGVLTSGGDAPGMNAAVRSLVKAAVAGSHTVVGIRRGYEGLLAGDAGELGLGDVDGVSRHGGTRLGSARCPEMTTPDGLARALARLDELALDGLVVIGGNGSLTGAHALAGRAACRVIGVPASIDNDVGLSALAIGVDTAVNTIVSAADRISDTATAHRRVFVIEVMGRGCGFLAMRGGIAADADAVLVPERRWDRATTLGRCREVLARSFGPGRNKERVLLVKAEGVEYPTRELVDDLQAAARELGVSADVREVVLGHLVRGGAPSALDRLVALRLGYAALEAVLAGHTDEMVAWDAPGGVGQATQDPAVRRVPLGDVLAETARMLDGTSAVARSRLRLLQMADGLLAL